MEKEKTQEIQLENLNKLSEAELKSALALYKSTVAMETYVTFPFLGIGILFLIHNVFLAGKSFDSNTYNKIMNTEMTIAGILILIIFIIAGISISKTSTLKKEIKKYSKKYHLKTSILGEEFSLIAIQMYGGRGIKIK